MKLLAPIGRRLGSANNGANGSVPGSLSRLPLGHVVVGLPISVPFPPRRGISVSLTFRVSKTRVAELRGGNTGRGAVFNASRREFGRLRILEGIADDEQGWSRREDEEKANEEENQKALRTQRNMEKETDEREGEGGWKDKESKKTT